MCVLVSGDTSRPRAKVCPSCIFICTTFCCNILPLLGVLSGLWNPVCSLFGLALSADVFELVLFADVFELALFANVLELLSKFSGRLVLVLVLVVVLLVLVSESVVEVSVVFFTYGFLCVFIFGSCRWR